MKLRWKIHKVLFVALLSLFICAVSIDLAAQEKTEKPFKQASLIDVAREVMAATRYCALITTDINGQPHVRTMDPFPPDSEMVVWFGTSKKSRKVKEIRKNPEVTLYYSAPDGDGYVSILGNAVLVDDPEEKARRWKPGWETYFSKDKDRYLLIKVTPKKLKVVSFSHNITGDPESWEAPSIEF